MEHRWGYFTWTLSSQSEQHPGDGDVHCCVVAGVNVVAAVVAAAAAAADFCL